jgi:hypothetical protein
MPLFFILSGIGACHTLAHQTWPQYLFSRINMKPMCHVPPAPPTRLL